MKGRAPTSEQKRFHTMLCEFVGCTACRQHNVFTQHVSVHHIDGRTKPSAHWLVLALCAGHHQDGTGARGMIAVHPWKARFEAKYGSQMEQLRRAIKFLQRLGHIVPPGAIQAAGLV
ncbi:Ref family recombination enhancement nuclease [Alcaligenaceae bacterium B3P038]|nr:Ref family recombination enhancement nuclease [Alcaligenaceae bacterium B3P038]